MQNLEATVIQWVGIESEAERRFFLREQVGSLLEYVVADETNGDITTHLSQQIKTAALRLLFTEQRPKTLELAESLLFFSDLMPPTGWDRARKLARARGLMTRFNYRRNTGQFEAALNDLREALALCEECGSGLEAIRCRMGLVHALAELGRLDEAWQLAELVVTQTEATGDQLLLADVLSNIGVAYGNKDDYQQAVALLSRQLEILTTVGEVGRESLAQCYYNLALNYLGMNRYGQVLEVAGQGRLVAQERSQSVLVASNEHLAASAHFHLGQFTTALRKWDEALYLFQHHDCPQHAHWVNHWRCASLCQLNRFEEALELCEQGVAEARLNGWQRDLAQMLYWRAIITASLDPSNDRSLADYEAAAGLLGELDLHSWLARLYLDQADLLIRRQAYNQAEQILMEAEQEFERQVQPQGQAQVRLGQARIAQGRGQLEGAAAFAQQGLTLAHDYEVPSLNYRLWQLLGEVFEAGGQLDQALDCYQTATTQIERLRGTLTLELRGDFLKDKVRAYEGVVHLALNRGDLEQAYDYIERSKSRALTEMLATGVDLQVRARSAADEPLVSELKRLRQEYNQYYASLNPSGLALPAVRANTSVPGPVRDELRRREKGIESLTLQLQVRNSAYAEDLSLSEITSESPQPWLDQQTLLVEYYIRGDEVLALAISANEKRVFRNLTNLSRLEVALKKLSLVLQNTQPHLAGRFLTSTQAQLAHLYTELFAPLFQWAAGFQKLIFVPHGPLHHLPFQALWNRATGRYLLEDFEISYLPAAGQLGFYRQRATELHETTAPLESLIMANRGSRQLAFVEQEAREVADALQGRLYLDGAARREVLEDPDRIYRVIHLAAHGQFRADAPLFSFVELADGALLMSDLFNLRLRASLITLSACESGLNRVSGGNELIGLSRACLYAGAASLLLSLWRVEDRSTASLMRDFYHRMLQPDVSKAGGLRQSQLAMLRGEFDCPASYDYRHPYFWASFCLIGEGGPL